MISRKNITGIILAGGKSSRMGTDKGLLELKGKSFVKNIIDAVSPLVNDIIIVSDNPSHDMFMHNRIEDVIKDAGPLAGLYSGLHYSKTETNLVVSCDVPLITTQVLQLLINNYEASLDVIQLESNKKTMPLTALYNKRCEKPIKDLLGGGERRVRFAVSKLRTKTIKLDDKSLIAVTNINTKEQLNKIKHDIAN